MLIVTAIEIIIIYNMRYAYSRLPIFAIGVSVITITLFYAISTITLDKYVRAYTFNFATIDLILLVIMYQLKYDLKNLPAAKQPDYLVVLGNKCMSQHNSYFD